MWFVEGSIRGDSDSMSSPYVSVTRRRIKYTSHNSNIYNPDGRYRVNVIQRRRFLKGFNHKVPSLKIGVVMTIKLGLVNDSFRQNS